MAKSWYFYVLQCADGTFYAGITTSLDRRLKEHNTSSRGAKYTRTRRPVEVVFWEYHENRSSALKREHSFKRLTRKQKEKLVIESRA